MAGSAMRTAKTAVIRLNLHMLTPREENNKELISENFPKRKCMVLGGYFKCKKLNSNSAGM